MITLAGILLCVEIHLKVLARSGLRQCGWHCETALGVEGDDHGGIVPRRRRGVNPHVPLPALDLALFHENREALA